MPMRSEGSQFRDRCSKKFSVIPPVNVVRLKLKRRGHKSHEANEERVSHRPDAGCTFSRRLGRNAGGSGSSSQGSGTCTGTHGGYGSGRPVAERCASRTTTTNRSTHTAAAAAASRSEEHTAELQ